MEVDLVALLKAQCAQAFPDICTPQGVAPPYVRGRASAVVALPLKRPSAAQHADADQRLGGHQKSETRWRERLKRRSGITRIRRHARGQSASIRRRHPDCTARFSAIQFGAPASSGAMSN